MPNKPKLHSSYYQKELFYFQMKTVAKQYAFKREPNLQISQYGGAYQLLQGAGLDGS